MQFLWKQFVSVLFATYFFLIRISQGQRQLCYVRLLWCCMDSSLCSYSKPHRTSSQPLKASKQLPNFHSLSFLSKSLEFCSIFRKSHPAHLSRWHPVCINDIYNHTFPQHMLPLIAIALSLLAPPLATNASQSRAVQVAQCWPPWKGYADDGARYEILNLIPSKSDLLLCGVCTILAKREVERERGRLTLSDRKHKVMIQFY